MIDLSGFTGSEQYHSSTFGRLSITDGVHFLREEGNCYWFIDIIESYQGSLKDEPFQVWKLKVNYDESAIVLCEDGNGNVLQTQELTYTDFKEQTGLSEIILYCIDSVVLLPSEY